MIILVLDPTNNTTTKNDQNNLSTQFKHIIQISKLYLHHTRIHIFPQIFLELLEWILDLPDSHFETKKALFLCVLYYFYRIRNFHRLRTYRYTHRVLTLLLK